MKLSQKILGLVLIAVLTLSYGSAKAADSYFHDNNNYIFYTASGDPSVDMTVYMLFGTGAGKISAQDITVDGTPLDSYSSEDIELGFVYTDSLNKDYCFNTIPAYLEKDGSGDWENTAFTVTGDWSPQFPGVPDPGISGYTEPNDIILYLYDHTVDKLYTVVSFKWTDGFGNPVNNANFEEGKTRNLVEIAAYSNAAPVSPADGAVQQDVDVTLEWSDMDAVADSYNVYFNTSNNFSGITPTNVTSGHTLAKSGLTPGQRYFWRVDAELNGSFIPGTVGDFYVKPNTPAITSPGNGDKDLATDEITFIFDEVTGAEEYKINIDGTDHTVASSPATVSGLTLDNCDALDITIQAIHSSGNNSDVSTSITATTIPGEVVLTSPADNAKEVGLMPTFSWDASAAGLSCADSYTLVLKKDGTAVETKTGITGTSYTTALTLDPMATYTWTVTPYNGAAAGETVAENNFRTKMDCFDVSTIDPENNEIQIPVNPDFAWGTVTGATDYDILLEKADGTDIVIDNTTSTSYPWPGGISDLEFEGVYNWTITARNADGETITCGPYEFTVKMNTPTPTYPADGEICVPLSGTMTWDAFAGTTQYEVQYKGASEDWTAATTIQFPAGTVEYAYSGSTFARNSDYVWRIQAEKGGIWTGWSEENEFSTIENPLTQTAPANGEKGFDKDNVDLTVTASANATSYTFEVATDAAFTNIEKTYTEATGTTNVSGLDFGTMYYWRATSDACGTDVKSEANVRSFYIVPDAVTLTYPADNATEISAWDKWQWTAVAGADGYEVAYGTASGSLTNTLYTTATELDFTNLDAATEYFWNVRPYQTKLDGSKVFGEFAAAEFSFTTKDLTAPKPLNPRNGAVNQMHDVLLMWESVPEAEFYCLKVALDNGFNNVLVDKSSETDNVVQTNYLLLNTEIPELKYGTTIYWKLMTAVDDGSGGYEYSDWGQVQSYTIIPEIDIQGDVDVCHIDDYYNVKTYTVTDIDNVNYTWTISADGTVVPDGDEFDNTITVEWDATGTQTVSVARSADHWQQWNTPLDKWEDYSDNGSTSVDVNAPTQPTVAISVDDWEMTGGTTYCVNERIIFTATTTGDASFSYPADVVSEYWVVEDVDASGNSFETTFNGNDVNWYVWTQPGTYTVEYYLVSNETNCMMYSYTKEVEISDQCDVNLVFETEPAICSGGGATQVDTYVYGGDGSAYSYNWVPCYRFTTCDIAEPQIKQTYQGFSFTVTAEDQAGNTFSSTKTVDMLYKPNPSLDRVIILPNNTPNPFDLENDDPGEKIILDWDHEDDVTMKNTAEWTDRYGIDVGNSVNLADGLNIFYLNMWNFDHDCYYGPARVIVYKRRIKDVADQNFTTGGNYTAFMNAYPNPATDKVNVDIEFIDHVTANFSVVDLEGNTVKEFSSASGTRITRSFEVSDLNAGTYFMLVETNDDTVIWKFIKQ